MFLLIIVLIVMAFLGVFGFLPAALALIAVLWAGKALCDWFDNHDWK